MKIIKKLKNWIDNLINDGYLYGKRVGNPKKLLKYFYCPKLADNAVTNAKIRDLLKY